MAGKKKNTKPSTQKYININEIRENTLIMDDHSMRSVLLVSSINFALKNEDEQNAIIGAYVNFLNNINFPIQIVIHSRELKIDNYIESLKKKGKEQTNELLKVQTEEYLEYISDLISMGKIMNKRFYVIVPYSASSDKRQGFFSRLLSAFNPVSTIRMRESKFKKYKKELDHRVDNVIAGLNSIGLNVVELDTQSLIELFYNIYNPIVSHNQELAEIKDIRVQK